MLDRILEILFTLMAVYFWGMILLIYIALLILFSPIILVQWALKTDPEVFLEPT